MQATKHSAEPLAIPLCQKGEINDSIPPLFDQTPGFTVNHVFPKTKYERLVNNLKTAKGAGLSVMFRDTYRVRKARHYGIEGGWNVEVLWGGIDQGSGMPDVAVDSIAWAMFASIVLIIGGHSSGNR